MKNITFNKIPEIKLSSGTSIPVLSFGTWMIGGDHVGKFENVNEDELISNIQFAIDSGFRSIRTAHNYADGYTEELVGKAIKQYDRQSLFLTSAANQKFAIDKNSIIEIAQNSLKSLKTDYFDLFLIGAINPNTSVKSILDGLMWLKEKGLAKEIGVSNYRLPELKAAHDYIGKNLVYSEMHYNLIIREPELNETLDYCRENNIVVSAYRPLQLGQLSNPGIVMLDNMAKKYDKSQSQIALKWLLQKPGVITMVKAIDKKHIDENLDLFNWEISDEDILELDKDFPIQIRISDCSEPRQFKF